MENKRFHTTFSGISSLVRCNLFSFFGLISFFALIDIPGIIGNFIGEIVESCCGAIGLIVGIVSVIGFLYVLKRRRGGLCKK